MGLRSMTLSRFEEIRPAARRRSRHTRDCASAGLFGCSRDTVREVRDGLRAPDAAKSSADPLWMLQIDWPAVV
jgi:hypothetical protein